MKIIRILLLSLMPMTLLAQSSAIRFCSVEGDYWKLQAEHIGNSTHQPQVIIRSNQPQQMFRGWGTCFNELDYEALLLLPEADRTRFLKRAFNPYGDLRLQVGRIPIGASDFALDWYSCDETPDNTPDFQMQHFTIERDLQRIIPSIKLAQAEQPDMTFWASPWSPPQWMKKNKHYAQAVTPTNGNPEAFPPMQRDQFVQDPRYYDAYCLYFDKFIQAYAKQGITISALAYQNEAYSNTPYPGCTWLPATTGKFLAQYLGPYMAQHHPDMALIAGTMNTADGNVFATILNTPGIERYVRQVGFQWEGRQQLAAVHAAWPQYELVQTESECGSGTFDWGAAVHTFQLCNDYLSNGVTTYTYWNAILTDRGLSSWGWAQNALVQVSSSTNTARYTPEYYAYKHYTHLIPAGSSILTCSTQHQLVSALTPDGNIIVVIGNSNSSDKTLTIDIDGELMDCHLPANSFSTYAIGTQHTLSSLLQAEAKGLLYIEQASLTPTQQQSLTDALQTGSYEQLFQAVSAVRGDAELEPFQYKPDLNQPLSDGSFFLYDITAGLFLGQVLAGTDANMPRLSVTPERISLQQHTKGYTISFDNRPAASAYLKLGVFGQQYVWADGHSSSTYWTFSPSPDTPKAFLLVAEPGHYTLGNGENLSGTWYLAGTNVSTNEHEAHLYALITPADYIQFTSDATPALLNPTIRSGVTSGWTREKNSASGYAELQTAICSDAYADYGISYWAPTPQTDARIIYQTVQGLPPGRYTLSAYAAATAWNNNHGADNRPGVSLFLSDGMHTAAVPVTSAQYAPYSVTFNLDQGQPLQLGLQADRQNTNTWAFLAGIRLRYEDTATPVSTTLQTAPTRQPTLWYGIDGITHTKKPSRHGIYLIGGRKIGL